MRSEKEIKDLAEAMRYLAANMSTYLRAEEFSMLMTRATTLEWVVDS